MSKKVYIDKAGCNRRQLDLERIKAYLEVNGYDIVKKPEQADRIIVATCAFKKKEEDESVIRIEALRKHNSEMVVFGCLPDIAPKRYEKFKEVPKVAPKEIEKIEEHFSGDNKGYSEISDAHIIPQGDPVKALRMLFRRNLIQTRWGRGLDARELTHQLAFTVKERAKNFMEKPPELYYLLVCRGCLGRCSYCAIRRSIGTVHSKPLDLIKSELLDGVRQGYKDFVILGDDPGCYGVDCGSNFAEMLNSLAETVESYEAAESSPEKNQGVGFHLKEVHPKFLIANTNELLTGQGVNRVKSLLCPIQSGSDRVLELMQREHTMSDLRASLVSMFVAFPGINLTTQVIVGFPSETDSDFDQTLEAVKGSGFKSVVVFPYDDKEGTEASLIPNKVPPKILRKRMRRAFQYFRENEIEALYSCP